MARSAHRLSPMSWFTGTSGFGLDLIGAQDDVPDWIGSAGRAIGVLSIIVGGTAMLLEESASGPC